MKKNKKERAKIMRQMRRIADCLQDLTIVIDEQNDISYDVFHLLKTMNQSEIVKKPTKVDVVSDLYPKNFNTHPNITATSADIATDLQALSNLDLLVYYINNRIKNSKDSEEEERLKTEKAHLDEIMDEIIDHHNNSILKIHYDASLPGDYDGDTEIQQNTNEEDELTDYAKEASESM